MVILQTAAFGKAGQLTRHMRAVHEKRRDHACPHCAAAFGRASDLTRHVHTVHRQGEQSGMMRRAYCCFCVWRRQPDKTTIANLFAASPSVRAAASPRLPVNPTLSIRPSISINHQSSIINQYHQYI